MNALQAKAPFMSAVFANLIFQGLVTYQSAKTVIDSPSYSDYMARNTLFNLLLLLGLFLVLVFAKLSLPFKFGLFTMISILMGAYLSPQANIKEALLEVVTIFIGMFILLFFGLLALILARLFSPGEKKYAKIGSLLFALFVVFDTNNILKKNYGGDFIDASLDYFLDILNLLQYRMDD